ncbi:MAG TPA: c(7)-type cytochrome triheme domain-containing protein [Geomonas sp.]|nr:c(7)-type cytochrome triheme domain-containing protein [Geomonas sp.]
MKRLALVCLILFVGSGVLWAAGTKKKKPLPYQYGSVTINNFSQQSGMPPVVFDHWLHRKNYTCRVCHVDIGFGMTANSTKMRAADNMKGYFCGTCHNGSTTLGKNRIFASCATSYSRDDYKRCVRCHAIEKDPAREEAFHDFLERMPRETLGNGIDWEKAELGGLIKPQDTVEGVSLKKAGMKVQPDFALKAKMEGMPDIIFSHSKHTVWNGCELCHPDIFVGIKRGTTKYSMIELFDGKYCGVCHDKVAFPQSDCKRCHAKPV